MPERMPDIDPATIERYRRDGYIVVEGLLDDVTRRRMKQVLAELIERARGVATHDDVYDLEPTHSPAEPRVRRIKKPHLVHPVFAEFMRSPRLLAVLSALLGPSGVRLHGSKLNLKAPEYGSPVEWHQDWAFYPHTNDDLLAVGVLLDDATEQNGPLLVLPGSHRGPTHDHHGRDGHFCGAIDPARESLDFAAAVPLIAPAGVVLVPSRAGRARLGRESLDAVAQPAALRVRRRAMRFRCSACPTGTSSTGGCWSARRASCRVSSLARSACRCRRRRTRVRSTRTRRRSSAATSTSRLAAARDLTRRPQEVT